MAKPTVKFNLTEYREKQKQKKQNEASDRQLIAKAPKKKKPEVSNKADYTSGRSSFAKMNTEAQSNRAKSSGGRTAKDVKATQTERKQRELAAKSKASGDKSVLSNKAAEAKRKKVDAIVMADTKMDIKKNVPKAEKNYNVGVSKGGVSFKEAFAHFRKKGNKTFTWNGKKYTTETASKKGKK